MTGGLRRSTATALLVLLGATLVGLPALLLALRDYPLYEASLQVRLLADPQIGDEDVVGDAGEQGDNFIDTELVSLNSGALRDQVAGQRGDPDLEVSAVRVGVSNVVEVTTRSSREDVDEAASSVLARYVEGRRAELQERILGIGGDVDRQLGVANAAIVQLSGDDSITAQLQRAALTAELTRLFQQRNTLQLASNASSRLVQVVATDGRDVSQVVSPLRNGVLGGLAGAVLGLALALGLDRLQPRVRAVEDLLALAPEVALPTLPHLRGRDVVERAGDASSSYVSALTSGSHPFGTPALVVVGPTAGCGATFLAVGLAVASARRRPTVLVGAGDALDAGAAGMLGLEPDVLRVRKEGLVAVPTRVPGLCYVAVVESTQDDPVRALEARIARGLLQDPALAGAAVVLDAPPLDSSAVALELARQSGRVLLVAGVERTSASELDLAARSLRRVGATLVGVVLADARGRRRRRRSRR